MDKKRAKAREERWSALMGDAQKGDQKAYETLLKEIHKVILAFIKSRVKDLSAGEDIVQEILIGIHNARHTYDTKKPFTPWMFAIARYKYIDHVRKWSRITQRELMNEGVLDDIASIDNESEEHPLKEELHEAIAGLPTKQRQTVELLKIKGLSVKEVSAKIGMSESAVKVTAHRAYKTLKKKLVGINS